MTLEFYASPMWLWQEEPILTDPWLTPHTFDLELSY